MSNRGRQNVASFLILDLQVDWRRGAVLWMIFEGMFMLEVQKTSNFCINYCLGCAFKYDFVILNSHCYLCLGNFSSVIYMFQMGGLNQHLNLFV